MIQIFRFVNRILSGNVANRYGTIEQRQIWEIVKDQRPRVINIAANQNNNIKVSQPGLCNIKMSTSGTPSELSMLLHIKKQATPINSTKQQMEF